MLQTIKKMNFVSSVDLLFGAVFFLDCLKNKIFL